MQKNYLYINDSNVDRDWAVVVLPEIYGLHKFIKSTVDKFANEFRVLSIAVDHLYSATGKAELFDYNTQSDQAIATMNQVTGEGFLQLLTETLDDIQKQYPNIKHFVVNGFCFGGRLAFLSGVDKRVSKIISYYGGGPHVSFYNDKGSVETLAKARGGDKTLSVLAFYGEEDGMIPASDRQKTKELLTDANISYQSNVFPTGHAFANFERASYNEAAANNAWVEVQKFLAG